MVLSCHYRLLLQIHHWSRGHQSRGFLLTQSCAKLCNIEYAMSKLDEMHKVMQVDSLTQNVKDYRAATMKMPKTPRSRQQPVVDTAEKIFGQLKLQIAYAENLKPVNKNGLANPYVIVSVPDATVVPPTVEDDDEDRPKSANSLTPTVLHGKDCELARSRAIYDSLNATWDETFQCILPPVDCLQVVVNSKNLISFDDLVGKSSIDLSRSSRLRRKLVDHQTHDVFLDLEPQGRLLVRITVEGEDEDVDFWFRKSRERLGRTRDDFVRALTAKVCFRLIQISPYARQVLISVFKQHEATVIPAKSYFSSLITAVEYSDQTASGVSIQRELNEREADDALKPLADYLDKNLEILCRSLSTRMAQEVIKRIWDEILLVMEFLLIAPLYGQIEKERRILNKRQLSVAGWTLSILKDFFHADGEGMGIPVKVLESRKYSELMKLIKCYQNDLSRLRREYELSLLGGGEKEYLLKLLRLRIERQVNLETAERDEMKGWFENQLNARKERTRRSFQ